ncbi:hypothetical protein KHM83_06155 [Fusibacter paucivorans]|uniref:Uncharacterized protein n=1 Tax=Fusibacter paucivorans TaxID=76009 RepID=A0ABS5PM45_9FIRM|nr:hypothetical protein [Fusibacter paucivorans]MBS7526253.1 hypothetical protein [Fusibacter paucivorans]
MIKDRQYNIGLVSIMALLTCLTIGAAFIGESTQDLQTFVSLRGETVLLYGKGIYAKEAVDYALQAIAQDIVTLLVGIPMLVYGAVSKSLRGRAVLVGGLAYFLYTYVSYCFLLQYNQLFLVYVSLMSLSFFGLWHNLPYLKGELVKTMLEPVLNRKSYIIFQWLLALMLSAMWLARIIPTFWGDFSKIQLAHYNTAVIQVLDLGIIVPLACISGYYLWRKTPTGYLLTLILMIKGAALGTALLAMIVMLILKGSAVSIVECIVFTVMIGSIDLLAIRLFMKLPA